jgi:hypothetical protein
MISLIMAEGQGASVDSGGKKEGGLYRSVNAPKRGGLTTRRNLFKRGARVAAATVAVGIAAHGISLPEGRDAYFADDGPVRMVLSNHSLEADSQSIWPERQLRMLDKRMRDAKKQGRSYMSFIDGFRRAGEGKEDAWPSTPHPNLSQQDQYPEAIYACSAELPIGRGYGLDEMTRRPEVSASVGKLSDEIKQWYRQPGFIENAKMNIGNIGMVETLVGLALLHAGIPDMKRRKFLVGALALGTYSSIEALKRSPILYSGMGILSDQENQKFATVLANTFNNADNIEFAESVKARTALVVEAANYAASSPQFQQKDQPPAVDLLYGTAHGVDLPRIMTVSNHRLNLIADFMASLLMRVDARIIESYPELQQDRDQILSTIVKSMTTYSYFKVKMPWGKTAIPKEIIDSGTNVTVPVLSRLSERVLGEFGISSKK